MVLDTSALLAILFDEPERATFVGAVAVDPVRLVAAPTMLVASIVAEGRAGDTAGRELDLLITRIRAKVVSFSEEEAALARSAWRRYGKGNHAASLNFGDCISYAAAKHHGEPLLFKGNDFRRTDITPAVQE